jgi:hypothetical protein
MSKANDYLTRTNKGTSFSGSDVDIFGMTVLALHDGHLYINVFSTKECIIIL